MASQMAMDVTSQNVSNTNTEGYSRQRVDVSAISAQNGPSRFALTRGSSVGQGVRVDGVTQIRDQFLDLRFRKEYADYGKWSAGTAVINDVENVIDEVSTEGLSARLSDFYAQLESFSVNADLVEYGSIFRSSAQKVAEVLNQYSAQLYELKEQYTYNTGIAVAKVNQSLIALAALNKQIKGEIIQGSTPNELMDSRNMILDDLAGLIGIHYETIADGQVSVSLGGKYLLDASKGNKLETLTLDSSSSDSLRVVFEDGTDAEIPKGSIGGYLSYVNGKGSFAVPGEDSTLGINYFIKSMDTFAQSFADNFNAINDPSGVNRLFTASDGGAAITAGNIKLSDAWIADAMFITRSTTSTGTAANDNLLKMIESLDAKHSIGTQFNGSFAEYVSSFMGELGVQSDYAMEMLSTSASVLNVIADQREAVMGVWTDEEAINMEKYQKSYNAAARVMTTLDEMIDVIINNMGLVGR